MPILLQISDATWITIDRFGVVLGIVTGIMALVASIWAVWKRAEIRHWFTHNHFNDVGDEVRGADTRGCGLVMLVSSASLVDTALKAYEPAVLALVASRETEKMARQVATGLEGRNVELLSLTVLEDPDDAEEAQDKISLAIAGFVERGLAVLVDVTGGKKPMSLGAFIAAEEAGQATGYISSKHAAPAASSTRRKVGSERVVFISRPSGWGSS